MRFDLDQTITVSNYFILKYTNVHHKLSQVMDGKIIELILT
jgi:hypothetical protein